MKTKMNDHQKKLGLGLLVAIGCYYIFNLNKDDKLSRVIKEVDAINATDPRDDDGEPKELKYGRRMSSVLLKFQPEASEIEQIAVRSHHIGRWKVPRNSYPEGKAGYIEWRSFLYSFHGESVGELMGQAGYDAQTVEKVKYILSKKGIKTKVRDPSSQLVEDVACLVFLEFYLEDFSHKQTEERLIDIVKKTWPKMSENAHAAALKLPFTPEQLALIAKALFIE